jgi:hypothetical protein
MSLKQHTQAVVTATQVASRLKMASIGVIGVVLAACSSSSTLTVYSQPEGARLTTVGTKVDLGRAPAVLIFDNQDLERARKGECFLVRGIRAEWESGASVVQHTLLLCEGAPQTFSVTFDRPENAPNLQRDLEYAQNIRLADFETHRLDQHGQPQYFPLQISSKPNGPSQPTTRSAP